MVKKDKLPGLCASCVNAGGCTFPRTPGRPVTECEEFEGACGDAPACGDDAGRGPRASEAPPDTGCVKGLCRTCTKRATCTFPKPEGGVWHCEEYD